MDPRDVKLLICYLLSAVSRPLPEDALCRLLVDDGFATFFDAVAALDGLCRDGSVVKQDGTCAITDGGRAVARSFALRLPAADRERAAQSGLRLCASLRRKDETVCRVDELQDGGCQVDLRIRDGENDLVRIQLPTGDRAQADAVVRRFENDPARVYRGLVALLTTDGGYEG